MSFVAVGNSKLLHLIASCLDASQLNKLVVSIAMGEVSIFIDADDEADKHGHKMISVIEVNPSLPRTKGSKKDNPRGANHFKTYRSFWSALLSQTDTLLLMPPLLLLQKSFEWETFEQICVWNLLSAELSKDMEWAADCVILPLLAGKLDPKNNAEAIMGLRSLCCRAVPDARIIDTVVHLPASFGRFAHICMVQWILHRAVSFPSVPFRNLLFAKPCLPVIQCLLACAVRGSVQRN